jgi:uncharacterized repeat protein (TIGR01451 family)
VWVSQEHVDEGLLRSAYAGEGEAGLFKMFRRLLPLLLPLALNSGIASAQDNRTPNLKLGDAVVTGFSGTIAPDPNKPRPAGKSVTDLTFINPDGPSARIVDVSKPDYVWDGRLLQAPKTFDVLAKDVGQVFGVALDDAAQPNIYLAATSAFGLNIVSRGRDGQPERRKKGGPGAGWMKGQFGLDLQGGPGAIYKVDGRTGVVTLFANVTLEGVPNPGASLGNLAYDSTHKQLFVSDLYTGMIHRFDLDGKELGVYDHGVTGLTAAKLPTVVFDPRNRPNIAGDRFDSEKPDTWGFAPAARRVFGLAVHQGRLYYSVVSGPQIWSVGIAEDGGFAADPRWELDVPAQAGPLPVSDIAFSQKGAMILAQRALIAGAYDYSAFTRPGEPQVFRIWLKGPNDPPSPGRWKLTPEEYAVGFAGNYRNTNGGVALGYGYGEKGALDANACEFSLWTTGQNLRNAPSLKTQLDPGGPLVVHGLAGVPASPVRDVNTPPWLSYSLSYADSAGDPRAAGHLGSVRIYSRPCASPLAYSGPGYPASPPYIVTTTIVTPVDCIFGGNCPPPGTPIDLGIGKIGENNPNNPYGPFNFTLGVRNLGAAIANPQTITVTDVVPPGMTFTNVTSSNWACVPLPGPPIPAGGTLTCTYTGAFPIAANQALGWVTIVATGGSGGPYKNCAKLDQPDSDPSNNEACVTVETKKVGELVVKKEVIGHVYGTKLPPQNFTVNVTCGGTSTTLTLTDGGSQTVSNIPYGTSCSVAEVPPAVPPKMCPSGTSGVWTVAYAPPQPAPPIVINAPSTTVTVTNTFDCVKDGDGSLTVKKEVVNNTSILVPAGSVYAISASCVSGMSPAVVTAMPLVDGGSQTVSPLALNTVCTITETPPVPPSTGPVSCGAPGSTLAWTTVLPAPVTVTGPGMTATVQNILNCIPPDGSQLGTLIVTKTVVNKTQGQVSTAGLNYPFSVSCASGGSPAVVSTFNITENSSYTVSNIALNSSCTVTEGTMPAATGTCATGGAVPTWALPPTIAPASPVPVNGTTVTVTVQNTMECKIPGQHGYYRVTKTIDNQTSNTDAYLNGLVFPTTSTCDGNAVSLNVQRLVPGIVTNIPVGAVCSVVETLPPSPSTGCPAGKVATWGAPVYAPPTVTIASGAGPVIQMTNVLTCEAAKKLTPQACKPPLVAGARPGECVCPAGMTKKGARCVEALSCRSPQKLNKAGTACLCPAGMTKRGNSCVEKERERPRVAPNDVIRVLPGLIGPGGFGGGRGEPRGGDGGGGKSPGRL